MVKLVIIADDFTGALDTGIQFAGKGIDTRVVIDEEYDFRDIDKTTQVLVVDAETRHLPYKQAYAIVYKITKHALDYGAEIVCKKTDSTLRGCIGSELTAVLDASEEQEIHFIPAFPKAYRTTKNGIHYFKDLPIHKSVFGHDPFDPVLHSSIPDIIKEQSTTPVSVVPVGQEAPASDGRSEKRIIIYDAQTDEDLRSITNKLKKTGKYKLLAGCAGLASFLPEMLEFKRSKVKCPQKTEGLLAVSGSLNPITKSQLDYAQSHGFKRIGITLEQKLTTNYLTTASGKAFVKKFHECCENNAFTILDAFNEGESDCADQYAQEIGIDNIQIRDIIANRMGEFVKGWLSFGLNHVVMLTGGDTIVGFMRQLGCNELHPICEIVQGAVLSLLKIKDCEIQIISKSGGFGEESILLDIAQVVIDPSSRASAVLAANKMDERGISNS